MPETLQRERPRTRQVVYRCPCPCGKPFAIWENGVLLIQSRHGNGPPCVNEIPMPEPPKMAGGRR